MPHYAPLMEGNDENLNPKIDRGRVRAIQAKLKKTGKKGAKLIASTVMGQAIPLSGTIVNLPAVYYTHKHIKRLNQLVNYPTYPCICGNCADILKYAIEQKENKRKRKGLASVPILSWAETTRSTINHFSKGGQGCTRRATAQTLWSHAKHSNATVSNSMGVSLLSFTQSRGDCLRAKAIIAELFGDFRKLQSWEMAEAILSVAFGPDLIAEKLQSV